MCEHLGTFGAFCDLKFYIVNLLATLLFIGWMYVKTKKQDDDDE